MFNLMPNDCLISFIILSGDIEYLRRDLKNPELRVSSENESWIINTGDNNEIFIVIYPASYIYDVDPDKFAENLEAAFCKMVNMAPEDGMTYSIIIPCSYSKTGNRIDTSFKLNKRIDELIKFVKSTDTIVGKYIRTI